MQLAVPLRWAVTITLLQPRRSDDHGYPNGLPRRPQTLRPGTSDSPPELKVWLRKRDGKNSADALKSYAELERAFSGDKIVLPRGCRQARRHGATCTIAGTPENGGRI